MWGNCRLFCTAETPRCTGRPFVPSRLAQRSLVCSITGDGCSACCWTRRVCLLMSEAALKSETWARSLTWCVFSKSKRGKRGRLTSKLQWPKPTDGLNWCGKRQMEVCSLRVFEKCFLSFTELEVHRWSDNCGGSSSIAPPWRRL